jgi:hypothetical protein
MFLPDAKNIGLTNSVSTNHRITALPLPLFQAQIVRIRTDLCVLLVVVVVIKYVFFMFVASLCATQVETALSPLFFGKFSPWSVSSIKCIDI